VRTSANILRIRMDTTTDTIHRAIDTLSAIFVRNASLMNKFPTSVLSNVCYS
jgi:hypothetical protein